mgnify:CR=1 FL=1
MVFFGYQKNQCIKCEWREQAGGPKGLIDLILVLKD